MVLLLLRPIVARLVSVMRVNLRPRCHGVHAKRRRLCTYITPELLHFWPLSCCRESRRSILRQRQLQPASCRGALNAMICAFVRA